jgi:glycosyltransferase involved in cell wall biosynthesis
MYKDLLSKSRAMIFLCEHETQGIAYQEALASNVPIIAWDHGWWTDPVWQIYAENPIPATSVPLFSSECGEKFKMISEFPKVFEKFWRKLKSYKPRQFIQREVSFKKSADIYCKYYFSI